MILTRDQILGAPDLPTETVPVPEWGGDVVVAALTGAERDELEKTFTSQREPVNRAERRAWRSDGKRLPPEAAPAAPVGLRALVAAFAIRGGDGARLFTVADVQALAGKSAAALDRVFAVACRLSGITQNDQEELEGNSDAGQSAGTGSA